jgi:hypothetical protein
MVIVVVDDPGVKKFSYPGIVFIRKMKMKGWDFFGFELNDNNNNNNNNNN